jgi:hypothetical protein
VAGHPDPRLRGVGVTGLGREYGTLHEQREQSNEHGGYHADREVSQSQVPPSGHSAATGADGRREREYANPDTEATGAGSVAEH